MPRSDQDIQADLFAAEYGGGVAETDLHGMRPEEARAETERFVNTAFMAGDHAARIVHGRGSGALRQIAHEVLRAYVRRGLVVDFRDAEGSAGGVTVFALHSREKK